jgi:hypothetical protein
VPIAPAIVKKAIRQNESENAERFLELNTDQPVVTEAPSSLTRIIPNP